jgi:DNA modification methylase
LTDYRAFLESKFKFSHDSGFDVPLNAVNPICKPHQRDAIVWALRKGRAAIFFRFGLGKTLIQTEILRLIHEREGGRHLVIAPLGIRQEFKHDAAELLGLGRDFYTFIRRSDEVTRDGLYITNYESVRDRKLDVNLFTSVTLDEASVLRSYGSKTYQTFLQLFDHIKYRFVATATPSPNRYKELIHYAGFLGVMDTGQALTRFFQRDSTQAGNLTLYPHMEEEFFVWLHSWALFVQRPSDLGYSDEGYALPPITVTYHELPTPVPVGKFDRDGQAKMIADAALSLKDAAEEKRESIDARVAKMMEIVRANPDDHFILWHDLEAERHAIKTALPAAVSVYGSQDLEEREQDIIDFSEGRTQYLSTKPEIAGSGCNFQRHCHKAIFLGITYKFNDLIQAIHRIHRFLQAHPVEIHIIYTEAERQVLAALQEKWAEDDVLRNRMSDIIRAHGLTSTGLEQRLARTIGCVRRVERSDRFEVVNNDSVDEYRGIESNRFGLIVTSIPFGNHYEYSESYNDFGHNPDNEAFFRQMDYLTPELLRTLKPGRVLAVHVKDRIRFGNVTGYGMPSVEPFHADCIAHYRRHGFIYFGMITIVTDVVRENNQTYRLGWTEQCKDGTKMGVGSPEYVLLFRKLPTDTSKGYADERVAKSKEKYSRARWQTDAHAFWRSAGDRLMTVDELATFGPDTIGRMFERFTSENVYDYEQHVRIGEALDDRGALPSTFMCLAPASHHPDVWHDVVRMRTLNGEQSSRGLANHICPLQFDVVDRLIVRYSNEDEEVSDPFGGLFTVPVRALKLKRRGHAVELNATYFFDGLRYVRTAAEEIAMPTLFNLAATEEKASA